MREDDYNTPTTMYGANKLYCEQLGHYYARFYKQLAAQPPDLDVERWHATIVELRRREPERLALIHFGVVDDVERHLDELDRCLDEWLERVAGGASGAEFEAAAVADPRAVGAERGGG